MNLPPAALNQLFQQTSKANNSQPKTAKAGEKSTAQQSTGKDWVQRFLKWLSGEETLRITEKCDRTGNRYYEAHDLRSNEVETFFSREDLVAWLERRHLDGKG